MGHRFTGLHSRLNLEHLPPSRVVCMDQVAISAFIGWSSEAIEYCPLNGGAKAVVDALIAGQDGFIYDGFSVACVNGFLEWVRLASEHQPTGEVEGKIVTVLTDYRDQLDRYQAQIRNYWLQ